MSLPLSSYCVRRDRNRTVRHRNRTTWEVWWHDRWRRIYVARGETYINFRKQRHKVEIREYPWDFDCVEVLVHQVPMERP